jgi:hypothetical protein
MWHHMQEEWSFNHTNVKASDSNYYKTSHLKQNISNLKKTKYIKKAKLQMTEVYK